MLSSQAAKIRLLEIDAKPVAANFRKLLSTKHFTFSPNPSSNFHQLRNSSAARGNITSISSKQTIIYTTPVDRRGDNTLDKIKHFQILR
ncbi:Uncharacterised protein [Pseudomonas putida]|nr:hypothetical protein AC138_18280 [Pseudomonas putida]KMY34120.1 hypothetical protein AA993_16255 [Pseudomonas putida]SKB97434.1 hypothetical protein SAMN05216307_1885 [Pseudomonas putida]SMP99613.1 hypothetical protein SAMN05216380_0376 [Pseudomonas putida]VEE41385.1 Uncharacterised protein [Pseudomonas putida]